MVYRIRGIDARERTENDRQHNEHSQADVDLEGTAEPRLYPRWPYRGRRIRKQFGTRQEAELYRDQLIRHRNAEHYGALVDDTMTLAEFAAVYFAKKPWRTDTYRERADYAVEALKPTFGRGAAGGDHALVHRGVRPNAPEGPRTIDRAPRSRYAIGSLPLGDQVAVCGPKSMSRCRAAAFT